MTADSERQTEARLTELEIKLAFTEDLVERLDAVVIEQQRQIDRLMQELLRLREQVQQAGSATSGPSGDERPPHY
ncbi:MAG: SlyX family protein [Burkholderiales bacterium]|nr:SlyX family protein [Burkholderiales bacterium]